LRENSAHEPLKQKIALQEGEIDRLQQESKAIPERIDISKTSSRNLSFSQDNDATGCLLPGIVTRRIAKRHWEKGTLQ